MIQYDRALAQLNPKQREAVELTEGPVLVIAGPGTGKTQLIGTRVGYILKNTDTEAANILLLTFTDAAVGEMRRRLEQLVPDSAYKVNIYTYHGFANDLIRNNLELFGGLERDPIDELEANEILDKILGDLPYSNPLKSAGFYKKQLLGFISDAKRALLTPEDIEQIAHANLNLVQKLSRLWAADLAKLDRVSIKSLPIFQALLSKAKASSGKKIKDVASLGSSLDQTLAEAIASCRASGKTTALTAWKNDWLEKDALGRFIPAGKRQNERLLAAAGIYTGYQKELAARRAYDYDDMLNRAIEVLEANTDFKYSLGEHYQYLMLDEFQDTNPAQMRLVELLSDHPVYENRPNVLAVGDDDQAIYAFQGANHAHMARFMRVYRDVKVISLAQNYRSHQDIIDTATKVAEQIETRLHHSFSGVEKSLVAAGQAAKKLPVINAQEFISDAAQYEWVANEIKRLIKTGVSAAEIAVLAPQHKYLEKIIPYLNGQNLPVAYERREDVLDDPKIIQLTRMAELIVALGQNDERTADSLWPEILSYDFWRLPTEEIWQIVWQSKGGVESGMPLTGQLLKHPQASKIAKFVLALKDKAHIASLEEMLDGLIGVGDMHSALGLPMQSPFFEFYFDSAKSRQQEYIELLGNLNILRERLRARQKRATTTTRLPELVDFIHQHQEAGINILNTSPYHQSKKAVNLLTAYGAKGREFKAVFVLACQAEVWGHASRRRADAIKLPANLAYIAYAGASDDERKRLFYVAISRAKSNLYLTSYAQTLDGQRTNHLEFLGIETDGDGSMLARTLPPKYQKVIPNQSEALNVETVEDYWTKRHLPKFKPTLKDLLSSKLETYKLSATHLNSFTDISSGGPEDFFIYKFLGFAQAPSPTSAFGTAMHSSLAWASNVKEKTGQPPGESKLLKKFADELAGGWLREDQYRQLYERGETALPIWLKQVCTRLPADARYEKSFGAENVEVEGARLTGKVDRLIIDKQNRRITVVDIKTGKAYSSWKSDLKLHKFAQQLMFYKLLVEGSNSFNGYTVSDAVIEFAEPEDSKITSLAYSYDQTKLDEFKKLVKNVWAHIQNLDLPSTANYPKGLRGVKEFEKFLIESK